MPNEEKIDLNKLSPTQLIIRVLDKQIVLEKELSYFIEKVDKKFESVEDKTTNNRIAIAVLQAKAVGAGFLGGAIVIAIVEFIFKGA